MSSNAQAVHSPHPTCIMALVQAQSRHLSASRPEGADQRLLARARKLRAQLIYAGIGLGNVPAFPVAAIAAIRNGRTPEQFGVALITLADLFCEAWPPTHDKTAVTSADLDEAAALGNRLLTAVGGEGAARGRVAEATLMRSAAFVHFFEGRAAHASGDGVCAGGGESAGAVAVGVRLAAVWEEAGERGQSRGRRAPVGCVWAAGPQPRGSQAGWPRVLKCAPAWLLDSVPLAPWPPGAIRWE